MTSFSNTEPHGHNRIVETTKITEKAAPRRNKMIRFTNHVRVRLIPHAHHFSEVELNAYWYSPSEYKMMRNEISSIVSVMNKVNASQKEEAQMLKGWEEQNSTTICLRGLESRTSKEKKLKFKRRSKAIDTVLTEQERQMEKGDGRIVDDEKISWLYQSCTYEDVLAAARQGSLDQEDAGIARTGNSEEEAPGGAEPKKEDEGSCTKRRRSWFKLDRK